jgi:hypothetical protein
MIKITTTSTLPPQVVLQFNKMLLMTPYCLADDRIVLWGMYLYIKEELFRKAKNIPARLKKCEELEKKFLELYERIKKKEEQLKEQTKRTMPEPFYFFTDPFRDSGRVYERLRDKRRWISYSQRNAMGI